MKSPQQERSEMFHDLMVQCPFCFEAQSLELEIGEQGTMIQDCEVCCHPWTVRITWDEDGEPQASIERA